MPSRPGSSRVYRYGTRPSNQPCSSQKPRTDRRYSHQLSGSNGEIPAILFRRLARWLEIGIRMVAKPNWFCLTMLPAASSHHFGDVV